MNWVSDLEKRLRLLEQEDKDDARELELLADKIGKAQQDAFTKIGGNYGGGICPIDFVITTARNSINSQIIPGVTVTATKGALSVSDVTDTSGNVTLSVTEAGSWTVTWSKARFTTGSTVIAATCFSSYSIIPSLVPATGYHSVSGSPCWNPAPDTLTVTDPHGDVDIFYNGTSHTWIGCDVTPANIANSTSTGNFTGLVCDLGNEAPIARTYEWNGIKNITEKHWDLLGALFGACSGIPEGNTTCADTAHSGHILTTASATASAFETCGNPISQTYTISSKIFAATVTQTAANGTVTLDE